MTEIANLDAARARREGRYWGKTGERLTNAEHLRRRAARSLQRAQRKQRDDRAASAAHHGWKLGVVAPWRITHALDAGGHEGPDVDIACGTEEPAVDEWEAGQRYPTFEQLLLLAKLTGFPVDWFTRTDEPLDIRTTTLWMHMTKREREQWKDPITVFSDDAVANCPGTVDYLDTHLF